jgi:hypothetical protein
MIESTGKPVSVSRTINVPAQRIFGILAHPVCHPLIDGSGMLLESADDAITGVGDVFTMKMRNDEMGDYVIANHVVEFEPDRLIVWEPVLAAASRQEDQAEIGEPGHHRWGYALTTLSATSTVVTEIYDCSRSPEWLRNAIRDGVRWIPSMAATLEKLDALSRG